MLGFREQLLREPFARDLLEALPTPVLILDDRLELLSANAPARRWLRVGGDEALLGRRPGDLLGCARREEGPRGCGSAPDCRRCLLRRSGERALDGGRVQQQEVTVPRSGKDGRGELSLLLSASPLAWRGRNLAVVVLQEMTELHRLTGLLPICASCKRIRREDQTWEEVEVVLSRAAGRDLTHSLCPRCIEEHYPEFADGAEG